jgi:hypothetical protein
MISIPRGGVDAAAEAPLGNRSWEISLAQTSSVDLADDLSMSQHQPQCWAGWFFTIVEKDLGTMRSNTSTHATMLLWMSCGQRRRPQAN